MLPQEMHGMHKFGGAGILVLGLLVLANSYWAFLKWGAFIGLVLILAGLCKMLMLCKHKKRR
ncbi:MAG: hypothetical protein NTU63_04155 [Candidatus Pacearchaeota archaeon]|nr:hypothetical protein [Candidatus Pacearchaeota archaeon]